MRVRGAMADKSPHLDLNSFNSHLKRKRMGWIKEQQTLRRSTQPDEWDQPTTAGAVAPGGEEESRDELRAALAQLGLLEVSVWTKCGCTNNGKPETAVSISSQRPAQLKP